ALQRLGYLKDASGSRFDWWTKRAVQQWQRKLGVPQSGEVALGELVAAPKLPSTLLIDDLVAQLGVSLVGGERIVSGASGTPVFTLALQTDQAKLVPMGATLTVHYQDFAWPAAITGSGTDANEQVVLSLAAPGGGVVCGKQCGSLPAATSYLLSEVAVVPPTTGPAVPVAAITTQANGTTTVQIVDPAGARTERTVTVTASQDGVAIVTGVSIGERVQVLSGSSTEPVPSGQPSK
ncbi:MAG: peptidoglycan-binding domain-containing protein, partial [Micropruina sp.]